MLPVRATSASSQPLSSVSLLPPEQEQRYILVVASSTPRSTAPLPQHSSLDSSTSKVDTYKSSGSQRGPDVIAQALARLQLSYLGPWPPCQVPVLAQHRARAIRFVIVRCSKVVQPRFSVALSSSSSTDSIVRSMAIPQGSSQVPAHRVCRGRVPPKYCALFACMYNMLFAPNLVPAQVRQASVNCAARAMQALPEPNVSSPARSLLELRTKSTCSSS